MADVAPKVIEIKDGCLTCRFFKPTPKGNRGDCLRFPPNHQGEFAAVTPDEWCGEFKLEEKRRDKVVAELRAEEEARRKEDVATKKK